MGIAIFTVSALFGPLQGLVNWFMPPDPRAVAPQRPLARNPVRPPAASVARPSPVARPLRVLRVVEPGSAQAGAGRMVISGRMADVCAELDRLAAAEARTLH
ncbi:MAG: hypothetical protein ABW051_00880 [Burkholderiaceae bacterium]